MRMWKAGGSRGAVLVGAVTCDAHHMTDPHPEGLGVSTCIELALKDAGVERDEARALQGESSLCPPPSPDGLA